MAVQFPCTQVLCTQQFDACAESDSEAEDSGSAVTSRPRPLAQLVLLQSGGGEETKFPLFPGENTVGRMEQCSVCINDPSISGRHASLVLGSAGQHLVYDLHSTNRTRKNDMPLKPEIRYDLRSGDQLRFGFVMCRFELLAQVKSPPPPPPPPPPPLAKSPTLIDEDDRGDDTREALLMEQSQFFAPDTPPRPGPDADDNRETDIEDGEADGANAAAEAGSAEHSVGRHGAAATVLLAEDSHNSDAEVAEPTNGRPALVVPDSVLLIQQSTECVEDDIIDASVVDATLPVNATPAAAAGASLDGSITGTLPMPVDSNVNVCPITADTVPLPQSESLEATLPLTNSPVSAVAAAVVVNQPRGATGAFRLFGDQPADEVDHNASTKPKRSMGPIVAPEFAGDSMLFSAATQRLDWPPAAAAAKAAAAAECEDETGDNRDGDETALFGMETQALPSMALQAPVPAAAKKASVESPDDDPALSQATVAAVNEMPESMPIGAPRVGRRPRIDSSESSASDAPPIVADVTDADAASALSSTGRSSSGGGSGSSWLRKAEVSTVSGASKAGRGRGRGRGARGRGGGRPIPSSEADPTPEVVVGRGRGRGGSRGSKRPLEDAPSVSLQSASTDCVREVEMETKARKLTSEAADNACLSSQGADSQAKEDKHELKLASDERPSLERTSPRRSRDRQAVESGTSGNAVSEPTSKETSETVDNDVENAPGGFQVDKVDTSTSSSVPKPPRRRQQKSQQADEQLEPMNEAGQGSVSAVCQSDAGGESSTFAKPGRNRRAKHPIVAPSDKSESQSSESQASEKPDRSSARTSDAAASIGEPSQVSAESTIPKNSRGRATKRRAESSKAPPSPSDSAEPSVPDTSRASKSPNKAGACEDTAKPSPKPEEPEINMPEASGGTKRQAKAGSSEVSSEVATELEEPASTIPKASHGRASKRATKSQTKASTSSEPSALPESAVPKSSRGRPAMRLPETEAFPAKQEPESTAAKPARARGRPPKSQTKLSEAAEPSDEAVSRDPSSSSRSGSRSRVARNLTIVPAESASQTLSEASAATSVATTSDSRPSRGRKRQAKAATADDDHDDGSSTRDSETSAGGAAAKRQRKVTPAAERDNGLGQQQARKRSTSKPDVDVVVMFTGVDESALQSIVRQLGGRVTELPAEATHLVTDRVRRTVKLLCCVARGIPVVGVKWLDESRTAGRFLTCADYPVAGEADIGVSLADVCERVRRGQPILTGLSVAATPSVRPEPASLAQIIVSAGGRFVGVGVGAIKACNLVFSCDADAKALARLPAGVCALQVEALLTGVLKGHLDREAFLMR